ncbi:hypothetical protein OG226_00510 [Streptomyces sp. NBC_01261]|uniref:hypothetical protein n=1 Tax=Streptomyces sp. NBC_01261 TaxID=2903802 RepID=UPI002E329566|nr:hypothetical protein [Streptomyces sp. NBC_01261]
MLRRFNSAPLPIVAAVTDGGIGSANLDIRFEYRGSHTWAVADVTYRGYGVIGTGHFGNPLDRIVDLADLALKFGEATLRIRTGHDNGVTTTFQTLKFSPAGVEAVEASSVLEPLPF